MLAVWAQIHSNTITTYASTTTITTSNNSNSQNFHNNSHRQRRSTGSSSSNNIASVSENSVLYLTPSQPSIPHFVNASFIIFCNTKQRTFATTVASVDATAVSSSASLSNTVQTDIETKWKDPNGVVRENTKGRVHVEKRGGSLALFFEHIALEDKGNWTCEVNSKDIKERISFELLVYQKISFDKTELVQSAREGRDATVHCLVKGDPAPAISWLFNGESITISNSTKYRTISNGLYIKNVTQADAGEYTCRAMRITSTFADSDQITILLRIQHKPHWFDNDTSTIQYAYIGGSVNISCDAMGEPPPSFTWLHDSHPIMGKNYRLFYADYGSTLQIHVLNSSHLGDYKCKVANPLGMLERIIKLKKGQKPAGISYFQVRRVFTDGFDLDIRSVKPSNIEDNMHTLGYRVEYMSEQEFKYSAGNWSYAKRKDFLFHRDGRRFVISNLKSNTTYLMHAASHNLAGLSDWSSVKIFHTLVNFGSHTVTLLFHHVLIIITLGFIVNSSLKHF
ncbi:Hemicentin-1 [Lucilia cuprina]|nr:Hemicentin-1 [Lucilia cuprina]